MFMVEQKNSITWTLLYVGSKNFAFAREIADCFVYNIYIYSRTNWRTRKLVKWAYRQRLRSHTIVQLNAKCWPILELVRWFMQKTELKYRHQIDVNNVNNKHQLMVNCDMYNNALSMWQCMQWNCFKNESNQTDQSEIVRKNAEDRNTTHWRDAYNAD